MKPQRVMVDANVLIDFSRGFGAGVVTLQALAARRVRFIASGYLELETLPGPVRTGRVEQVARLRTFFDHASIVKPRASIVLQARTMMERFDLSPMDALHLATAMAEADMFVSTERRTKPLFNAAPAGFVVRAADVI